jgi:uncharacterized membrane protein
MKKFKTLLISNKILIILLIFAGLLSACSSSEYNLFGSIQGEVRGGKSGGIVINPPPIVLGAEVILLQEGRTLQSRTTKAGGTFEFTNLDAGEYTVSVQKAGYETAYCIVKVVSGETASLSVLLIGE